MCRSGRGTRPAGWLAQCDRRYHGLGNDCWCQSKTDLRIKWGDAGCRVIPTVDNEARVRVFTKKTEVFCGGDILAEASVLLGEFLLMLDVEW